MAVPKRKTSKSRKGNRKGGKTYSLPHTTICPHCHQPRQPHRVCPHCGYYKGKVVMAGEE